MSGCLGQPDGLAGRGHDQTRGRPACRSSGDARKALWIVIAAAGATGSASTAPTTGLEIPKQAAVGLGDLALLGSIYNIYFDEEPDQDSMIEMLKEAGVLLAVGGGFAYGSVKLTEAVLAEILNFVPVVGWLVSGAITASVTTTVGALWCWACDQALRRGTNPVAEIQAMLSLRNVAHDHSPEPIVIA